MRLKLIFKVFLAVLLPVMMFDSCAKENMNAPVSNLAYPNAIVTVKTNHTGVTYFQLDDKTTLEPVGWKNPYKAETRALVNYSELQEKSTDFSRKVRINWVDSILTKKAVLASSTEIASQEGNDPVRLYGDWMTVCEDGYITIHFATQWGGGQTHKINLLVSRDDRHKLYLRHDKNGDMGKVWRDGIAAFKVSDLVPDTESKEVELELNWLDYYGKMSVKFKYVSPKED